MTTMIKDYIEDLATVIIDNIRLEASGIDVCDEISLSL